MAEETLTHEEFKIANGLARVPDVSKLPPPRVPVVYEEACTAIVACTTINEAKYWSAKADALAAWAKIYCEDKVTIEAKRLKLHAYRRMAELADQVMYGWRAERGFRHATVAIVLKDHGIPEGQARIIAKIGEIPAAKVKAAIEQAKPPTPSTLALVDCSPNPQWTKIRRTMGSLESMIKGVPAANLTKHIVSADRDRVYEIAQNLIGWCFSLSEEIEMKQAKRQKRASNE